MRLPMYVLPLLVAAALAGGHSLRAVFTQPTAGATFHAGGSETLVCTVDGLKCKGTAGFFLKLYEGVPGIASIETFASEHKAVFAYDPSVVTPDRIREIMEAPVPLRDGSRMQVFRCAELSR